MKERTANEYAGVYLRTQHEITNALDSRGIAFTPAELDATVTKAAKKVMLMEDVLDDIQDRIADESYREKMADDETELLDEIRLAAIATIEIDIKLPHDKELALRLSSFSTGLRSGEMTTLIRALQEATAERHRRRAEGMPEVLAKVFNEVMKTHGDYFPEEIKKVLEHVDPAYKAAPLSRVEQEMAASLKTAFDDNGEEAYAMFQEACCDDD